MKNLNPFCRIPAEVFAQAARQYSTPLYLYDGDHISAKCSELLSMPNAYGLSVRFAMKANSTRAILLRIAEQGVGIDASSLNEARRAHMAGIPYSKIILTTQELHFGEDRRDLEAMMREGLFYNVCSMRQLELIADFAAENTIALSMRIHPGIGSGESASRNTGDDYSCFGVHSSVLEAALDFARQKNVRFTQVHAHIGSGGDPEIWRKNIDVELDIVEKHFPDAVSVSFGGGLKVARVPGESESDLAFLGEYAKKQFVAFYERTGRKLHMEIEPGTYLVANAGYAVTTVIDKKSTGENGFDFIIANGGMEINARPLLYGSQHPFYVISAEGKLISSDFDSDIDKYGKSVVVGVCCESGDSQSLDDAGNIVPRPLAEPDIGDLLVIGGTGAYCSAMTPFNYNSHTQIPEVMATGDKLTLVRKRQTLDQMVTNEL